jgi:hypothetical protein
MGLLNSAETENSDRGHAIARTLRVRESNLAAF